MTIIEFVLIPIIVLLLVSVYLFHKKIRHNKLSLGRFTLLYWSIFVVVEIVLILYLVFYSQSPQFFPPSLVINFVYGTPAFIYFLIICLTSKSCIREKINLIIVAGILNYIVLPIGLVWLY